MAFMNAYMTRILGLVGSRDPLPLLRENLEALLDLVPTLDPHKSYGPGKWTAREVMCHLADCELGMGFRLRQALSEDQHQVQPFDENLWAQRYGAISIEQALQSYTAQRLWHLSLFKSLSPADLQRRYHHPQRGEESLQTLITFLAGHDLNHLAQLQIIAQA